MKKKLVALSILVVLGISGTAVALFSGEALAWTYGLTGSGECQENGKYKITWVLDNTAEKEALKITASSRDVVPVGTSVTAESKANFTEEVSGDVGATTLTVKGNFNSDETERERTATVTNTEACKQPTPPVVTPPTTTPPTVEQPKVTTPVAETVAPVEEAPVADTFQGK